MLLVSPTPFAEAVTKLGSRSPIGAKLTSDEWAQEPVALRERAFFSAQVTDTQFLGDLKGLLTDWLTGAREEITLPDGTKTTALKTGSRAQFIEQARAFADKHGLPLVDPEDTGSLKDIRSERRLALIFDVQTQAAHAYGSWKQGMDPDVLNAFPAQRFIREVDVQTPRHLHQQENGTVRRKDDLAFWIAMNSYALGGFGVPWGPWGFNSGMGVEDVDRDDAEALGLVAPGETVQPFEAAFNDQLKASVRNLSDEMRSHLESVFGDQIKIEGDAAWWKGDRQGKKDAGVAPKPRKKPVPDDAFPDSPDQVEVVKKLGGSTGAELVRTKSGTLFVRKYGANADHLSEEHLADTLYRTAGASVPESRLYDGPKPAKLARYIEGKLLKDLTGADRTAAIARIRELYAVDAWLGNWDVGGMGLDNILIDANGQPWRIDNGGSLRFRAQGARKSDADWNKWPKDLWTMRDAAANPTPGKLFGGMSIYDVARSAKALENVSLPADLPAGMRDILDHRRTQILSLAQKAMDYESTNWKADYADRITRHMLDLRASDVFARLSKELRQANPGVRILQKRSSHTDRVTRAL